MAVYGANDHCLVSLAGNLNIELVQDEDATAYLRISYPHLEELLITQTVTKR